MWQRAYFTNSTAKIGKIDTCGLKLAPKLEKDVVEIGNSAQCKRIIKTTDQTNKKGFIGNYTCYNANKEIGHISYHIKDNHVLTGLPEDYYAFTDKFGKLHTKPIIEVNMLDGQGCGTELLQTALKDALKFTDGRLYLSAETVTGKSPVGFYYRLGLRSINQNINKTIEELIKTGKEIPAEKLDSWMYLPKENISLLQNYCRKT